MSYEDFYELLAAKVWIHNDRQRQYAHKWMIQKGFNGYAIP